MTCDVPLAYFITWTCYGTWLHGRASGSVDDAHNCFGDPVLPPDPVREAEMRRRLIERLDKLVEQSISQPPEIGDGGTVFKPRQRRLTGEVPVLGQTVGN